MNIVDSSGWLEYFAGGENASFFAALQNLFKSVHDSLTFGSWFNERCLKTGLTSSPQA